MLVTIAIIIALFFIIVYRKEVPTSKDVEKAKEFLSKFNDIIYQKLVEATKKYDVDSKFEDYFSFEESILESGYILSWKAIKDKIAEDNDLSKKVKYKLFTTSDFTIDYIKTNVLVKSDIRKIINSIWLEKFEKRIEELEEEEDISYGIDEDGNKVPLVGDDYIEDVDMEDIEIESSEDFDSGIEPMLQQKIIPPSDSEYITEVDENDEIIIDSNGRKRNKKNGRFV
jgi:hypothetical protein